MKYSINILTSLFILLFISACGGGGGSSSSSSITSFDASPATITIGDSTDLTAVFNSSDVGNIDNNIGSVTSETPVTVTPSATTTYTLSVTKSDGSVDTATVTVTVVAINALNILDESLDQVFQTTQPDYTASVSFLAKSIQINAIPADAGSSITVNGTTVGTDNLSHLVSLDEGVDTTVGADTVIDIIVTQNSVSKAYKLTVSRASEDSFIQQAILKATDAGAGDEFGYVVALSGDTLAVGAPSEESTTQGIGTTPNNSATNVGAVYVFVRSGDGSGSGSWSEQAYIKASNAQDGDAFGISVALSGDTLVVGAIGENSSTNGVATDASAADELADNSGAVYVYQRNGSSWIEQAYIKASNTQGSDEFGSSVAVFGNTLAVGALNEDSSTTGVNTTPNEDADNSGAVYIFSRSDSSWVQQAYIKASNSGASDDFGNSLALFDNTLAVGAHFEASSTNEINSTSDNSAFQAGAVYIFTRSNTVWAEQAYIKGSFTEAIDRFGESVSLSGDTLAVGAYLDDTPTVSDSGGVYIFTRLGNIWSEQAYLTASNAGTGDNFGINISLSGDVLVVGAPLEDSGTGGINQGQGGTNKNSGVVYVYNRTGNNWNEPYFIKASTPVNGDNFGRNVSVASDTIAVGVPLDTSSTGKVYIFE